MPLRADIISYSVRSDEDEDSLYRINLTTGALTRIGAVGFSDVEGLSFLPGTHTLFGWDDTKNQLITINLSTGVGTALAKSGPDVMDVGLTFAPDGNLWLASEMGGDTDSHGEWWSLDPATGGTQFKGSIGRPITALAANAQGIYGIDPASAQLVTLAPATGTATTVGNLGIPLSGGASTDIGLDFDRSGTLWGLADDGQIFTVNPSTGQATVVHKADSSRAGFESLAITAPEPATCTLLASGLLCMLGWGWRRMRAQRGPVAGL